MVDYNLLGYGGEVLVTRCMQLSKLPILFCNNKPHVICEHSSTFSVSSHFFLDNHYICICLCICSEKSWQAFFSFFLIMPYYDILSSISFLPFLKGKGIPLWKYSTESLTWLPRLSRQLFFFFVFFLCFYFIWCFSAIRVYQTYFYLRIKTAFNLI